MKPLHEAVDETRPLRIPLVQVATQKAQRREPLSTLVSAWDRARRWVEFYCDLVEQSLNKGS